MLVVCCLHGLRYRNRIRYHIYNIVCRLHYLVLVILQFWLVLVYNTNHLSYYVQILCVYYNEQQNGGEML